MHLHQIIRIHSDENATIGYWRRQDDMRVLAFTLEDQYQFSKVRGETRIPAGFYPLAIQAAGRLHTKAARIYPDMHQGMILLQNVHDFAGIMPHWGNTDDDTLGCPLIGNAADFKNMVIMDSRNAYMRWYPVVLADILSGKNTVLQVIDQDNPPIIR